MVPAVFIFDTEDGTISAWTRGLTPADNAVLAVDNSKIPNAANGAVYKGLAFGVNVNGAFLFATNFRAGTIDVFGPPTAAGSLFTPATTDGGFTDPNIPAGFAPFGIQNINGDLFVTYDKQNAQNMMTWPVRATASSTCSTPTAICCGASPRGAVQLALGRRAGAFAFGRFSGDILVGNFGDGRINVFDSTGIGLSMSLTASTASRWRSTGLWTLTLGGGPKSSSDTLFFTAGPNGQNDGLFGTITPAADTAANQ